MCRIQQLYLIISVKMHNLVYSKCLRHMFTSINVHFYFLCALSADISRDLSVN